MADTTMTTAPRKSVLVAIASRYSMEPAAFEQTVRATCGCANATREEFAAFLLVANEYQLNPVTREIFAFPKKGGGIQPIVSIDGWLSLANRHPQMDGYEVAFDHDEQGRLVSATCTLHRKDRSHPTVVTEYLAECARATDPWKMQHRMLRHKATIQAIRCAFGFAGIMEPDEAETIIDVVPQAAPRIREAPALPAMTEVEWDRQRGTWASLVSAGKRTADDILAMARTRWTLSADQEDTILAMGLPVTVAADGEVIDAADRGDAWEPETTSSTEGSR